MSIEELLVRRQAIALKKMRGLRTPRVNDIFNRLIYLSPRDLMVSGYLRSKPAVAFNPGAILEGDELLILPRLIFDYYKYVSSIGLIRLNINEVFEKSLEVPIESRILLWPTRLWEFLGCEDPRVFREDSAYYILYTGKGFLFEGEHIRFDVLGFAEFDSEWRLKRKGYFVIEGEDESFLPYSNKDSALISIHKEEGVLLTRPEIDGKRLCWRSRANIRRLRILGKSLEPVLVPEEWELKVGWSTNTVKLSKDEYLVGWHGVLINDMSYRNGLAIVDGEGKLLGISDYLLAPKGLIEEYGDRPLVIFGDGLVRYKEFLIWIGGVSDYAIGIFYVELDKALENIKWIKIKD